MSTQAELGNTLFDSLIKLRERKGAFNMEDVGVLFEQIYAKLHPSDGVIENDLKEEIEKLALFIEQTKSEMSAIVVTVNGEDNADGATLHLDAVTKATEEAGHIIMDAADTIQAAANNVGGEHQQVITDAVTRIYEACNFQDLTCQRVNKVVKILDEIDYRINTLLNLFGTKTMNTEHNRGRQQGLTGDEHLLNGPQLPNHAPSQADIDALFTNYKP